MQSGHEEFKKPDTERMISIVDSIVTEMGVKNFKVPEVGPGILLHHILDENGLIPPLMMKMDIDSLILTGKRIWEVSCVVDRETLFGMTVEDRSFPGETLEIESDVIHKLMAKHALSEIVSLNHSQKSCSLKPLPIYYLYNLKEEEGSEIGLPPLNIVDKVIFNEMLMDYWSKYSKSLEANPDLKP